MKATSLRTLDKLVRKIEKKLSNRDGILPGEIDMNVFDYNHPEEWVLYRNFQNQFENFSLFDFDDEERRLIVKLLKKDRAAVSEAYKNVVYSGVDPLGNRVRGQQSYDMSKSQEDLYRREGDLARYVEEFMPFVERVAMFGDKVKRGFKKAASAIKKDNVGKIELQSRPSSAQLDGIDTFIIYCVLKKYYCNEARCIQDKFELKYPSLRAGLFDINLSRYADYMKIFEDTDNLKVSHEALKALVQSEDDERGWH